MEKKFKKLLAVALSLIILSTFCAVPMTTSAEEKTPLKFGSNGKFKIVVFSDVQDQYPVHQRVISIMRQALTREQPDLVIFTGDQTEMNTKDPEVDFRKTLAQILEPVVNAGVPYAFVFGNHDTQGQNGLADKDALLSVYQSIGDCRTVDAAPNLTGTGTCKIPIYASSGNNLAFNLWMVDSNSYQDPSDIASGYDNPHADQLAWMAQNNDAGVNSIVFQHIPMPETYNLLVEDANGAKTYGNKKYAKTLNSNASGYLGEYPCPPYAEDNTGEFTTLKNMGNVLGVVTGHDHLNDFTGIYDGIKMTAVPGMTYFNYGDEAVRGYGVIELDEADLSDYEYHSVKYSTLDEEAGTPTETTYDTYDEITYSDLKMNGQPLSTSDFTISGGHTFTYDATSPSYSAVFKYRWTAGSKPGYQVSFDEGDGGNIAHPFGLWIKRADQVAPNGAWHLKPNIEEFMVNMASKVSQGDTFDIELGRLKVLTGAPQHIGQYYVYLKVNGVLIKEGYSNVDENGYYSSGNKYDCQVSNNIRFGGWGNGGDDKISATLVTETYETPTEIGFTNLKDGNSYLSGEKSMGVGSKEFTFDANTYSNVVKFTWKAGVTATNEFKVSFDEVGDQISDPFGFGVKASTGATSIDTVVFQNGLNTASKKLDKPIEKDDEHDIELGRLKVLTGSNAGKYYVYLKFDNELIGDGYVSVDGNNQYTASGTTVTMAHSIRFVTYGRGGADKISAMTVPVVDPNPDSPYYEYDEIEYSDLKKDGSPVSSSGTNINSGNVFTYDATSPTYSAIFKFRWTAGSDTGIQFSFDKMNTNEVSYPFAVWVKKPNDNSAGENGAWHLKPTDGNLLVNMDTPVSEGNVFDIEFARLKVKNGDSEHIGQYYIYLKVNGELIQDTYSAVDENGAYTSGNVACQISNEIVFADWGGYNNIISAIPVPEIYEDYDEITFDDLYENDISMSGMEMDGSHNYTYNATSPTYSLKFKYRWIAGETPKFSTYFDEWKFPFCFAVKTPNQTDFGAQAGPNGSWHLVPSNDSFIVDMDEPIVIGNAYDIEVGRLKVSSGSNAGKYYVYFMVDGELIQSYYYDGVVDGMYNGVALSNKIIISAPAGNKFTAVPFVEEYEAYDKIGYADLKDENGNALGSHKAMSGAAVLTYNRTSPTGSAIFKYRWKIGTAAKFQMSFEKTASDAMAYMFGAWLAAPGEEANYPNGRMWLRPGSGPQVNLTEALASGTSHNVEFARLKVKTGPNKGKYYVYIKIDDVLIAEDYVAADVVDASGNYISNPNSTTLNISNEIFFAFWGSDGNEISPFKEPGVIEHEGTRGDFDNNGIINATDLATLRKILLGIEDTSEMPEGIADFNNDGNVDVRDLIAIKKYLSPVNTYSKSGSLNLGTQEHLENDATKTAAYIADASATLGAGAYRLSMPIHTLFSATTTNGVTVKNTNMNKFRIMVAELKNKGINEILYVTDSFILPYGYSDPTVNHNKTVPDPVTDSDNYVAWLTVNATAFKELAQEFPEIKFFEPYNEINVIGNRLEKYGIGWDASEEEQASHRFTVKENAGIMADLCWYVSQAVKSVDYTNQVTTPSVSVDTNHSHVQGEFLDEFYKCIESGAYPTNKAIADKRIENYFTIINIHSYPSYSDNITNTDINNWANRIHTAYNVVKSHNNGGSRVWLTETGMSTSHSNGAPRNEQKAANIIGMALNKLDTDITYVDTVFFYKLADVSSDKGTSAIESKYGLFYSGDDMDNDPYSAKPIAKTIYSFFNGGSTDYSAIDALVSRYAE